MAKKKQSPATVGFVALGCPKNIVDSEKMLAQIVQAGFLITAEPEDADVVVINTCSFIAPAKSEALDAIKHALDCKLNGRVKKVIVAGCLPQRMGRDLFNEANGIDAIIGLGQREQIARIIKKTLASNKRTAYLAHSCRTLGNIVPDDRTRLLITPPHYAYLRISEGCNHRCSFCTIPAIRGAFRSKPQSLILEEAAELASAGVVELNIIGQDTTYYGRDLKKRNALGSLLRELDKIAVLRWLRLLYAYPSGIDDRLIRTIAASERIVPYIDMPIQHVNNMVLKAMRRPDSKERICELIDKLRSAIPSIVLRTTLIAGFPGETDRQFGELLEFVKWAEFDALGCFKFYAESGTAAADMPDQIPDEIKRQRLDELMLTQQSIAFAKNRSRIGSRLTCLVDSIDSDGTAKGRFYGQAPEIDSVCLLNNCSAAPGQFVDAKVIGTNDYDLIVEQI